MPSPSTAQITTPSSSQFDEGCFENNNSYSNFSTVSTVSYQFPADDEHFSRESFDSPDPFEFNSHQDPDPDPTASSFESSVPISNANQSYDLGQDADGNFSSEDRCSRRRVRCERKVLHFVNGGGCISSR